MDKKIKVLILGWAGMLWNALVKYLWRNWNIELDYSLRRSNWRWNCVSFELKWDSVLVDLEKLLRIKYDYVINCIGHIRPENTVEDTERSYFTNSYFPHVLASMASLYGSRVIHVSTDCVFSWKRGWYTDTDIPDETWVYGMSKFLGEIKTPPHITLRTSIIGREFGTKKNLLDWFLSQSDWTTINGYSKVFWNGVTTLTLSRIIERIIVQDLFIWGWLYQIGSETVDKYKLLSIVNDVYKREIQIQANGTVISDKAIIPSGAIVSHFSDLIKPLKIQIEELESFYR